MQAKCTIRFKISQVSGRRKILLALLGTTLWGYNIVVIKLNKVLISLSDIQNRTTVHRKFDLNSQVWLQTNIARHKGKLACHHIHFEIKKFVRSSLKYRMLVSTSISLSLIENCKELKFINFLEKKRKFGRQNLQNSPANGFFVFHFWNLIDFSY